MNDFNTQTNRHRNGKAHNYRRNLVELPNNKLTKYGKVQKN